MKKKVKKSILILRMFLGIFFWVYLPIKVFIFDIDRFVLNSISPNLIQLLDYRILIYISLFLILLSIYGLGEIVKSISLSLIFPIYLFSRGVKKRSNKNNKEVWEYLQKLGMLISIFLFGFGANLKQNFKIKIFLIALSLISVLIIFATNLTSIYQFCISLLCIYLLFHYYFKIYQSISPSNYFVKLSKSFSEKISLFGFTKSGSNSEVHAPYVNKKYDELESITMMVYFMKKWINKIKDSPYLVVYFIFSTLYTIVLTVLVFSIIYFGIYKIDANYFNSLIIEKIDFSSFVYFSLKTFFSMENNILKVTGIYPDIFTTIEGLSKYIIGIIYTVFLINIFRHQLNNAVSTINSSIDKEMDKIDDVFKTQHKISIEEAIKKALEKVKINSNKNKNKGNDNN